MGKITIVPVYNDIRSCLKNSLQQGRETKHYDGLDKLIATYRNNDGRLATISREYPDVSIRPVDCSHNQGPRPVNCAKALKWSYKVSSGDIDGLLSTLLSAVKNGEIGMSSLRAAAGDLYSIPGLSAKGRALADSINSCIDEALKEYIQR